MDLNEVGALYLAREKSLLDLTRGSGIGEGVGVNSTSVRGGVCKVRDPASPQPKEAAAVEG